MRIYEAITILRPQLSDAEVAEFVEKTKQLVATNGGEIVSEEKIGRRRFSHEINKNRDGFYSYMKFKANPVFVEKLKSTLKLDEQVLRASVMKSITSEPVLPAATKTAAAPAAPAAVKE